MVKAIRSGRMVQSMMEIGKTAKQMEEAYLIMQTVMSMKENLRMIRLMVKESIITRTDLNLKDNGKLI